MLNQLVEFNFHFHFTFKFDLFDIFSYYPGPGLSFLDKSNIPNLNLSAISDPNAAFFYPPTYSIYNPHVFYSLGFI